MSLDLILGPMFAGKTTALIAQIERFQFIGYRTFIITHSSDTRYVSQHNEGAIATHTGKTMSAYPTDELLSLRSNTAYIKATIIAIEEAHFFEDLYDFVVAAVETDGKKVICVGLNGDYRRDPIGQIHRLIPFADIITKIDAVCVHCSKRAPFTRRRLDKNPTTTEQQILVGGSDIYEPVCRQHFLDNK